jgi:hypothetical protein
MKKFKNDLFDYTCFFVRKMRLGYDIDLDKKANMPPTYANSA